MSIVIENLTKMFGENKALDNISLTFNKNEITGLIGFNGSGKTTTYNALVGFLEGYTGTCTIDGKPVTLKNRRKISYLAAGSDPKNPQSALKHLLTIANMSGASKKWAMKKIDYYSDKLMFTSMLKSPMKTLSKGNQQKVKLIASFLNPECEIMLLDEPFDGLDPIMVESAKQEYLKLENTTIIITSHRMDVVQKMVNEFYVLKNGVLVDARKTTDEIVVMRVNSSVSTKELSKNKYVLSIEKTSDFIEIEISGIEHFKDINLKLIKSKDYIYSSLVEKNIAESVFEKYKDGE